ncbi:hypothetical protein GUJ93_ZPchr0001g32683 [Zizania palustris]|uniref:Uncharacterized protein n=1 Tax=Zizania palustris TaxID=103762 RepID=A0A8J5R795_ZIZPA|nr:hypothetical protein GUJ93_ZPchr0001g32683 [Zizania palustris]
MARSSRVLDGDDDPVAPMANGVDAEDGWAPVVTTVAAAWMEEARGGGEHRPEAKQGRKPRKGVAALWSASARALGVWVQGGEPRGLNRGLAGVVLARELEETRRFLSISGEVS